jgi:hypothetical protein
VSTRRLGASALALALIASLGVAIAQDVDDRRQRLEGFDPGAAADQSGADLAFPDAPDPTASFQTMAAYQATLQAYYAYRKTGYEHRLGVFAWQSLSTKVIFVVVLLLVLAGIYFAAIQFHAACAGATASTRRGGDRAQPVAQRSQGALTGTRRDHLDHLTRLLLSLPRSRLSDQE